MPTKKVLKKEKSSLIKKPQKEIKEKVIKKKPIKKVVKKVTKKKVTIVDKTVPKNVSKKKASISKTVKVPRKTESQIKKIGQDMVIWATGKRKTAIARVKFSSNGTGEILVNKKPLVSCSLVPDLRRIILEPLILLQREKYFLIKANVKGGGTKSQAEAVRLGIARALVIFNPEWRKELKSAGFLRRDSRKKERKKPGLKRARRAPQWSKR